MVDYISYYGQIPSLSWFQLPNKHHERDSIAIYWFHDMRVFIGVLDAEFFSHEFAKPGESS